MKGVLLDDELPGLQYLKLLCQQIPGLEIVRAYNDPRKFLDEYPTLSFDFCILDIQMPGIDGLGVAAAIKGKPVIFITGYKEYAADAFDLDAVDYVRKPIDRQRFEQAIKKMEARLATMPAPVAAQGAHTAHAAQAGQAAQPAPGDFARLNSSQGKILLYFEQVLLVTSAESDPRDKRVFLDGGKEVLLKNISFTQLLAMLPQDQFARINKKTIVRLKAVAFFNAEELTMDLSGGPLRLPLSEAYRQAFHYKKRPG